MQMNWWAVPTLLSGARPYESAACDLAGEDFLDAVGELIEGDFVGNVVELINVPRAGQLLPHIESLGAGAFRRVDAGERYAAEDERVNREGEVDAGDETTRGDAATMMRGAENR